MTIIDGVDLTEPAEGHLLPPKAFTSAALFERELRDIFETSWVHVADLPELENGGDFVTGSIGRTPVVVVRGHDGELRGFLNACRHRAATLAEGAGNCGKQLKCPYHAWTYATDGRLQGVPHRKDEFGDRDLDGMGLIPIRVATLGPMVFGCLSADAPDFSVWAGNLGELLGKPEHAALKPAFGFTYDVKCNWKTYVENGLEGYHLNFVHDVLNDMVVATGAEHFFEPFSSYSHAPISPQYQNMFPPTETTITDGHVRFGHIFPNLIPVVARHEVSYLRIDPVGPETIRLTARSFDPGTDLEQVVAFRKAALDRTNQQDIEVVERVQRGLNARGLPAGVHSSATEVRIGHFERLVAKTLRAASQPERVHLAVAAR